MPDNKNALPLGTILNTRYEIEGLVGGGGFGLVYRARHLKLNSIVAIKELFPGDIVVRQDKAVHPISDDKVALYQKVLSGFRKEGQRLARLGNCLSIVRCHDYFEENGTGYLVMEYVEGKSLRELVRTYRKAGKSFSEDALISLVRKLLAGLKEVHKAGIQHMDIKPENIYLRQAENLGELSNPVLLDFGASRSQTGHSTGSSLLVGTVPYAPLEQMYEGGVIGPWTDIYALGITLYELVFERANIPGSTERLAEFHSKGIDPLEEAKSKGKSGYSEKFLRLIDKSIEIKAADRPQSVEELEEKLSLKSEQKLPESDERFRVSKTVRQPFTFKESYKGIATLILLLIVGGYTYISKPDTGKVGDTGQVGGEQDKKRGIDLIPPWIVSDYYNRFHKEKTDLDEESYKRAVQQNGSLELIESMKDQLYLSGYNKNYTKEQFDEESGFNRWRDELPGSFSNWARGVGEVLTEVGEGVLETGASVVKAYGDRREKAMQRYKDAGIPEPKIFSTMDNETIQKVSDDLYKYAQKAKAADLGHQQSYQITSPDEFWERISAGNVGEALGYGVHEASKSMVPFIVGVMISPATTALIILAYYTGKDATER